VKFTESVKELRRPGGLAASTSGFGHLKMTERQFLWPAAEIQDRNKSVHSITGNRHDSSGWKDEYTAERVYMCLVDVDLADENRRRFGQATENHYIRTIKDERWALVLG